MSGDHVTIFFLLCLILEINYTICNDYISDHNLKRKHERRISKKIRGQHQIKVEGKHNLRKGQEYDMIEDKEPIAQIDVASFIQKPDEFAVGENLLYETETKKSETNTNGEVNRNSYNEYGSPLEYNSKEDIAKRSNNRPYYLRPGADKPLNLGAKPFVYEDAINSRHLNLDSLSTHGLNNGKISRNLRGKPATSYEPDSNIVHKPEKKCAIKEMLRLPFFFHNKSETVKPKKANKRKLICFNCSNKKPKEKKSDEILTASREMKGSEQKEKIDHQPKASIKDTDEEIEQMKTEQIKRDKREPWFSDRERQLKELEEIQRKVDSVEILPAYGKMVQHN